MGQSAESSGQFSLPAIERSPWWELGRRALAALALFLITVLLVWLNRAGFQDNHGDDGVSLIDSFYFAATTLTTAGDAGIAPVSDTARFVGAFVITPLRIAFLVLLIGTMIELLAARGRGLFRIARWRKKVHEHVVIIGYGTKGRSAALALQRNGVPKESLLVVDADPASVAEANNDGLLAVAGDATRRDVLGRAEVERAAQVIITAARDDTTVLSTLTVRQLNPDAYIVAAVREGDNVALVRQSGADNVITSSDAVGRLLGLSSLSPSLGSVMEDLMTYGDGLEVAERDLLVAEVGRAPQALTDQVIAVVRDEKVYRYYEPTVTQLARGDRLIVVRPAMEKPWAPRPGTHHEIAADEEEE